MLYAMSRSYSGILEGDRVRWTGPAPAEQGPVNVSITVVGPAGDPPTSTENGDANGDADRGQRMAELLAELASSGAFADVKDPSGWQRDMRADRALPGRDGDDALPTPDAP
jgi:hypothetical protein